MKVAVIGAGPCGLPTIKACLEEGLDVVGLEYRDGVGGLWNYSDDVVKDGLATVMRNTVTNLSKESMAYSDFLMPRDFPQYLPHAKLLEYYKMYTEHFKLTEHIRFNTEVVRVKQSSKAGQWEVTTKNIKTNVTSTEIYDAVLVSTGHDGRKYTPQFDGQDTFQGHVLHAHDYRDREIYRGKKVVIVGSGNSALDIAVDLSEVCSQVYVSSRRGFWIVSRIEANGLPFEYERQTRASGLISHSQWRKQINSRFNHEFYGVEPNYGPPGTLIQIPTLNDVAQFLIASGQLLIRPGISKIKSHSVVFNDGSTEDNIDAIIYATGYSMDFSTIDHKSFEVKQRNDLILYKMMFAPDIQPPTLAMIGNIECVGSYAIIAELQGRYAARVLSGAIKLPDAQKMRQFEEKERAKRRVNNVTGDRQMLLIHQTVYMDSLAKEIGCNPPSFLRLLLTDSPLCKAVYRGIFTAQQYRLVGPGAWPGAREAILGVTYRLMYPVNPAGANKLQLEKTKSSGIKKLLVAVTVLGIAGVVGITQRYGALLNE